MKLRFSCPEKLFQLRTPPYLPALLICLLLSGCKHEKPENELSNELLHIVRDTSTKFSKPIRYFDLQHPSKKLDSLKQSVSTFISENISSGNLFTASAYIRNLETGEWTIVNENEKYHPGSLIKLPMLIYYLKLSEQDPGILDQKMVFKEGKGLPNQTYSSESIEANKPYTIKELLRYMICYSDNKATMLLNLNCNIPKFQQIYSDLNIGIPDVLNQNYVTSVKDYSVFLRVLYNGTYLNPKNSDYALDLLSQSSFRLGLVNSLPAEIVVARKFGEMQIDDKRELHEGGIVYFKKQPYLIVVMTKGYNPKTLANMISSISNLAFTFFCV